MSQRASRKNLLFLSYGEDPLQNNILQNQFVEFAQRFDKMKYQTRVHCFLPISRMRLFKNQEWNKKLQALETSFDFSNTPFSHSTLPILASWLYANIIQFLLVHHLFYHFQLARLIRKHQINYVYCRGYHAAFAACLVRWFTRGRFVIHFDPRSLFIEEGIYLKKISGLSLKFWRRIEKFIYETPELVTFVNGPFAEVQGQRFKIKKSMVMYPHAVVDANFVPRKVSTGPLRLCYSGQMDDSGWHRISPLLDLFAAVEPQLPCELLIITRSPHEDIQKAVSARKIKNVQLTSAANSKEVAKLLATCHYGVLSYKDVHGEAEEKLSYIGFAAKSGEYFAAGLPIISNRTVNALSQMIEEEKLGITYELGQEAKVGVALKVLMDDYEALSQRCRQAAETFFDIQRNVATIEKEIDLLFN